MADSEAERQQGLSGWPSLAEDEGMLFVFDQPGRYSFWMRGMKFPLDFVWIKSDEIVEITANGGVKRMNIQPQQSANRVLEVNSGFAARHNLKIGDKVSYESVSD